MFVCEKCLYRNNCQFLARHKNVVIENCTVFKNEEDFILNIKTEAYKEFEGRVRMILEKRYGKAYMRESKIIGDLADLLKELTENPQ